MHMQISPMRMSIKRSSCVYVYECIHTHIPTTHTHYTTHTHTHTVTHNSDLTDADVYYTQKIAYTPPTRPQSQSQAV